MIRLRIYDTRDKTEVKSVQVVRTLTIGSAAYADVKLPDRGSLSRLHALVIPLPEGRVEVRDLFSRNGTYFKSYGEIKRILPQRGKDGRAVLAYDEEFFTGIYRIKVEYKEIPGEPTLPAIEEADDEATGIEKMDFFES